MFVWGLTYQILNFYYYLLYIVSIVTVRPTQFFFVYFHITHAYPRFIFIFFNNESLVDTI